MLRVAVVYEVPGLLWMISVVRSCPLFTWFCKLVSTACTALVPTLVLSMVTRV